MSEQKQYAGSLIITDHNDIFGSGEDGRAVVSTTAYWLATSESTGVTREGTLGWTPTIQIMSPSNKYLWKYERTDWSAAPLVTYVEAYIAGVYGEDALSVFLTNEAHTFPADSSGVISGANYALGKSEIRVFYGTTEIFAQDISTGNPSIDNKYRLSAVATSNITITKALNGTTNRIELSPSAMTQDGAKVTLTIVARINGKNTTFTKELIYSKSKEGPKGADGEDGLSAFEIAVIDGYTGTEEEFYRDLGSIGELGIIQTDLETLTDKFNIRTFTPSEKVSLDILQRRMEREVANLQGKLGSTNPLIETLQDAFESLQDEIATIAALPSYEEENFESLNGLYNSYIAALQAANAAADEILPQYITTIAGQQTTLKQSFDQYTERLSYGPDGIVLQAGTSQEDAKMILTATDLVFEEKIYKMIIDASGWRIEYNSNPVATVENDEMRIPKIISSEYVGVGRIKFQPVYDSEGLMIGTDLVFIDDPNTI